MNNIQHEETKTFHQGSNNFVVLEGTRIKIESTQPVNIYSVLDDGTYGDLLAASVTNFDRKLFYIDEIHVEALNDKTSYNFMEYRPTELDKTPVEVPIEKPPTQLSLIRQALAQESRRKEMYEGKMSFEEFIDLNMPDELPDIFEGLTPAQATAEAIRQHHNPLRGFNLEDYDKGNRPETNATPAEPAVEPPPEETPPA
jgi:hypothetical protein